MAQTVVPLSSSYTELFWKTSCFFQKGQSSGIANFSCNSSLQQLRDNTGCCANFLLTDAYLRFGSQRNPNLWSNCSLQRPNDCQSSLSFVQTQSDVVCSRAERTYRLNRLNCNPDYVTPFIDLMRSCGLGESAQIQVINRTTLNYLCCTGTH